MRAFTEINDMLQQSVASGALRDRPAAFVGAIMASWQKPPWISWLAIRLTRTTTPRRASRRFGTPSRPLGNPIDFSQLMSM